MNEEPTIQSEQPVQEEQNQAMRSLVRTLRLLFAGLRLLIVAVFITLVFGGVFYVEEYERAMLFRFGRLVPHNSTDTFGSGWYWGWPKPVDRVRKIRAERSVTVTTDQFWVTAEGNPQASEQTDIPDSETLRPGEDGYLVTGDANIMHMVWSCTYRIDDPKRYYLGLYAPEKETEETTDERGVRGIIRSLLANAVLAETARWPVEDVYRLGRAASADGAPAQALDRAVWDRLERHAEALDLGIDIQHVGTMQVQPPAATQKAFREVADAANEYQTALDGARAYRERTVSKARGEEASILAKARAYKDRVVKAVRADVESFQKFEKEYREAPEAALLAFYIDTLREVLAGVDAKYVLRQRKDGNQEVRIQLSPKPKVPNTAPD